MIRRPTSPHQPDVESAIALPGVRTAVRSEARITSVVRAHHAFVWRLLRRLGVEEPGVDDATQKVFVIAARRIGDIAMGSERSFLFGTAVRIASQERSAFARREQPDPSAFDPVDPGPSPEDLADRRRARRILDEVLRAMPMRLRTAFVLFELEQMTKTEVAELLDIPVGTAVSRLRKAREQFRQRVARILKRRAPVRVTR